MMYPEDEKRALDLLGFKPNQKSVNLDKALIENMRKMPNLDKLAIDSSREFFQKVFARRTTPMCSPVIPPRDQVRIAVHNALHNPNKKLTVQAYMSGDGMAFNPDTRKFFYPHGVLPKKVIIGRTEGKTRAIDLINWLESMSKVVAPRQTGKATMVHELFHEIATVAARDDSFMDLHRQTFIKDMYGR